LALVKTRLFTLAFAASLVSPFSTAQAVGTQTYNVCGGSYGASWTGFAFCASVQVSVVASGSGLWNVAMQISNLSGLNGSYAGSLFAQIGLDNLNLPGGNPKIAISNVLVKQGGSTICSNATNSQQGNAGCWSVAQNQSAAGGIKVDLLNSTSQGVNLSASSACSGQNNYIYTCLGAAPVTISFDINRDFDPSQIGDLYVKAQGQLGSTECETGTSVAAALQCTTPPVTSTPEPTTMTMLGTGIAAMVAEVRRRRKKGVAAELDIA
jgi:hypothetical protein